MNPFERLWKDRMDIYRWVPFIENGITKSKEEKIDGDIKCHYSKSSLTDTGDNEIPTLKSSHFLFCSYALKEGDKIIVTQRNGNKIELTVGEGFPYSGGMQYSVKRDDTV